MVRIFKCFEYFNQGNCHLSRTRLQTKLHTTSGIDLHDPWKAHHLKELMILQISNDIYNRKCLLIRVRRIKTHGEKQTKNRLIGTRFFFRFVSLGETKWTFYYPVIFKMLATDTIYFTGLETHGSPRGHWPPNLSNLLHNNIYVRATRFLFGPRGFHRAPVKKIALTSYVLIKR